MHSSANYVSISIHVPLAGDDLLVSSGEHIVLLFLSTSPLRGTTQHIDQYTELQQISIHVPLAGDDQCLSSRVADTNAFLSTSPLRGTTC